MRVIVFGATGMIGHGVVKECLADPGVEAVLTVGRRPCPEQHGKLAQALHDDFLDLRPLEEQFKGYDACLYCLGVSSSGMSPEDYHRVTVGYTKAAAESLTRANLEMVMCFISGAGTSAESGQRWARVKAEAEGALRAYPWKRVHCFRPGFIQPMGGVTSTIASYRALYAVLSPLYPLLKHLPSVVTSTVELGRAMIAAARDGGPEIVESRDIARLARGP